MIFNFVLIIHFIAFLFFISMLAQLFFKQEKILNKNSILMGATILITGLILVSLKYPNINYYKIVPKSILFLGISIYCGIYSRKPIPSRVYYLLIIFTIFASVIAIYKT